MPDGLNLIRNPEFRDGVKNPRSWEWSGSDGVEWSRDAADGTNPLMRVSSNDEQSTGVWTQRIRCKPKHWYRIEAVVSCDCETTEVEGGAKLLVRPATDDGPPPPWTHLCTLTRTAAPHTMRAFYETPDGVRRFEVGVGQVEAAGSTTVHSVYVVPNIAPDAASHPMALPPPSYAYPAPRRVRTVCVCDSPGADRQLVELLRVRCGRSVVDLCRPSDRCPKADALIIPGDTPPRSIRSLSSLLRAGSRQLVVISLQAFARIAGDGVRVRRIEQPDDPLCAKVHCANFITRGFALHDVFPFASAGIDPRVDRQRQLRKGAALQRLRKAHGFETVLTSVTDSDSSTGHPICLYKEIDGGGIVVLDIDPAESPPTICDEPNLAAFVIQNVLGFDQTGPGYYTVPALSERLWDEQLEMIADRFPPVRLSGTQARDRVVEIGGETESFGLVQMSRPVLLIRSLLRGDDFSGVYATWYYLRQLIRPEPFASPYAVQLLKKFRLMWKPINAPWGDAHGTRSTGDGDSPVDPAELAAVIDVTESPVNELHIIHDRKRPAAARELDMLKTLSASLSGAGTVCRSAAEGTDTSRRDDLQWRTVSPVPVGVVDPKAFADPLHRQAAQAGARLIRIEVPGRSVNFAADSIRRTDLIATTLENIIGLQYGFLAVNRRCEPRQVPGYARLAPGEAVLTPADGKAVAPKMRAG